MSVADVVARQRAVRSAGPPRARPPAPGSPGGGLVLARTAMPEGQLDYALYPHALLRGTGFDVSPLLRVLRPRGEQPLEAGLAALREAFADPRLAEAVGQSNPLFHGIALAPGRALTTGAPARELTKRGRRHVRTAHRYLRRLLGKTETNAFFGPTLVVRWDPDLAEPLAVAEPQPEHCVIGLSHWLVTELAERQRRAIPVARRGWRRDPLWRVEGLVLHRDLDRRTLALTEPAFAVWQALASPATAAELRAATGLPAPQIVAALSLLAPALRPHPHPPSTLVDGLGWLLAHRTGEAPAGPSPDGSPDALVDLLADLVGEAQRAPWPRSLELRARIRAEVEAAGIASARAAGKHYADRDVVNEDRSSPWSGQVRLGLPALRSAHAALAGVLPMMLTDALLRQADAREAVARATGGVATRLVELAVGTIEPVQERSSRWRAGLAGLVPPDESLVAVDVDPADLQAVMDGLWPLIDVRDGDQLAALPGVDLMLTGGPPGEGRWVLSECHDDSSSAIGGITGRVQPGEGREYERFCAAVAQWLDVSRMATVLGRRRSRHVTPELPGITVELSGSSCKPADQVVAAADVMVSADGAAVEHAGRRYQLYPGDVAGPLFTALSLPCLVPVPWATGRSYTPRVVIGGVVVQRRRWVVDLPGSQRPAGTEAVTAQLAGRGLPEQFFLRHPDEPKPLLIDLRDPLCRAELARLRPDRVVCNEVLPDLADTWWTAGGRQPAELRLPVLLRWDRG
jgi:hypothetical protein